MDSNREQVAERLLCSNLAAPMFSLYRFVSMSRIWIFLLPHFDSETFLMRRNLRVFLYEYFFHLFPGSSGYNRRWRTSIGFARDIASQTARDIPSQKHCSTLRYLPRETRREWSRMWTFNEITWIYLALNKYLLVRNRWMSKTIQIISERLRKEWKIVSRTSQLDGFNYDCRWFSLCSSMWIRISLLSWKSALRQASIEILFAVLFIKYSLE